MFAFFSKYLVSFHRRSALLEMQTFQGEVLRQDGEVFVVRSFLGAHGMPLRSVDDDSCSCKSCCFRPRSVQSPEIEHVDSEFSSFAWTRTRQQRHNPYATLVLLRFRVSETSFTRFVPVSWSLCIVPFSVQCYLWLAASSPPLSSRVTLRLVLVQIFESFLATQSISPSPSSRRFLAASY
jgi:hypothetical protein